MAWITNEAVMHWITRHRGRVLIAMLVLLHLAHLQGVATDVGRVLVLGHFGLFLLWQPFVQAESHLERGGILAAIALPVGALFFLDGWWFSAWLVILSGIIGGRVFFYSDRAPRLFHLLALGYAISLLLLGAIPGIAPVGEVYHNVLGPLTAWGLPSLLVAMALIRLPPGREVGEEPIDLAFSVFVMLLLAVMVLGTLTLTLLRQANYVHSLLQALFAVAGLLLFASWAWNPKAGFSGLGALASRYMLSVGLPLEQWLHVVAELSMQERQPEAFLAKAAAEISAHLPWVLGGQWQANGRSGDFGEGGGVVTRFDRSDLHLSLYTRSTLTPALIWHFNLVTELLDRFYQAKLKERELHEVAYLRAVHETGARLTHDMKNQLQSLNSLMFAVRETPPEGAVGLTALIQKQLPLIIQRMQGTVTKLSTPGQPIPGQEELLVDAATWWREMADRYADEQVFFAPLDQEANGVLAEEVFSGALENLVQNARRKKTDLKPVSVEVRLRAEEDFWRLEVTDTGQPVPDEIARNLGRRPVSSENGLGIGLLQLSRIAALAGYTLDLAENRSGCVRFALRRSRV